MLPFNTRTTLQPAHWHRQRAGAANRPSAETTVGVDITQRRFWQHKVRRAVGSTSPGLEERRITSLGRIRLAKEHKSHWSHSPIVR